MSSSASLLLVNPVSSSATTSLGFRECIFLLSSIWCELEAEWCKAWRVLVAMGALVRSRRPCFSASWSSSLSEDCFPLACCCCWNRGLLREGVAGGEVVCELAAICTQKKIRLKVAQHRQDFDESPAAEYSTIRWDILVTPYESLSITHWKIRH